MKNQNFDIFNSATRMSALQDYPLGTSMTEYGKTLPYLFFRLLHAFSL